MDEVCADEIEMVLRKMHMLVTRGVMSHKRFTTSKLGFIGTSSEFKFQGPSEYEDGLQLVEHNASHSGGLCDKFQ